MVTIYSLLCAAYPYIIINTTRPLVNTLVLYGACVRELIYYYYEVPQERPEAQSSCVMTGSGCAVRVVLVYYNVYNIIILYGY